MMKHTKETIVAGLMKSNVWVEHALVALYKRQTDDEQVADVTSHKNGQGFTGADAEYYSKLARWVINSRRPAGHKLTQGQIDALRGRNGRRGITKYAGQLLLIAQNQ